MHSKSISLYADRLPPLIGGMEMHAQYFIRYFKAHSRYPLVELVTKDVVGEDLISRLAHSEKKPSIVFFNSGRWIEQLPELKAQYPEAQFIYRTGGNEIIKAPLMQQKIQCHKERQAVWVSILNETVDVLITNSHYTEQRLLNLGVRCDFQRCVGGVDCSIRPQKKFDNSTLRLFCAARFVPYKNHHLLIDVIQGLHARGIFCELYLAGDGPLLVDIKNRITQSSLSEYVHCLGVANAEQVAEQIGLAHCYIQLSSDTTTQVTGGEYVHAEGMGRSILEAISYGTYVIAGRSGALSEIVHADRGCLIDLAKSDSICDQVAEALSAMPTVLSGTQEYDWSHYFKHYEGLFE